MKRAGKWLFRSTLMIAVGCFIQTDAQGRTLPGEAEESPNAAKKQFHAEIRSVAISRAPTGPIKLALLPVEYPIQLKPTEATTESRAVWRYLVRFSINRDDVRLVYQKLAFSPKNGEVAVRVPLRIGAVRHRIFIVDNFGKAFPFEITLDTSAKVPEAEPTSFLVGGPVFYLRSVSRSGSALSGGATNQSGTVAGLRAIYRHRLFKTFTDAIPGKFRMFGDLNVVGSKTLGGEARLAGWPIWIDGRGTLEVFSGGGLRVEVGAGVSAYLPVLTAPQAGDVQSFISVMFSGRVGYPLGSRMLMLLGANVALPSSVSTTNVSLTSMPMDFFASIGYAFNKTTFMELRGRYYRINTSGTIVLSGDFTRLEQYYGPEILFVKSF